MFPLHGSPRFKYVPVERFAYRDNLGTDMPILRDFWAITGTPGRMTARFPPNNGRIPWQRHPTVILNVYFIISTDTSQPDSESMRDIGGTVPIPAEFIVLRRSNNELRIQDMRQTDIPKAEATIRRYDFWILSPDEIQR